MLARAAEGATGGSPARTPVAAPQAGVALVAAGAASTTKAPATTSVAVSTSVATPTTASPTTTPTAPYVAPAAVTTLSGSVAVGSGGGSTQGPAELVLDGGPPIEGNLALQVALPAGGTSICSGYVAIKFLWPAVIGARPAQLTATTTFVAVEAGPTSTTYDLVGAGQVSGDNQQLDNDVTLRGQLIVPDTGAGTASFTVIGGSGVGRELRWRHGADDGAAHHARAGDRASGHGAKDDGAADDARIGSHHDGGADNNVRAHHRVGALTGPWRWRRS